MVTNKTQIQNDTKKKSGTKKKKKNSNKYVCMYECKITLLSFLNYLYSIWRGFCVIVFLLLLLLVFPACVLAWLWLRLWLWLWQTTDLPHDRFPPSASASASDPLVGSP